jgi:hypothetical protein
VPVGQTRRHVVADDGAARERSRERGGPKENRGGGERVRAHLWACGGALWFCRQNAQGAEPRGRRCPYVF